MADAFLANLDQLIRARYTLLYVVTWEEERARAHFAQIAQAQNKSLFEWSITDGIRRVSAPRGLAPSENQKRQRDALAVLNEILQTDTPALFVLKDFHNYLDSPDIVRQLRDLAFALRQTHKTIIILAPTLKIPLELEKATTILDLPLPSYEELSALFNDKIANPAISRQFRINLNAGERDSLIKAAQGLTLSEAENAFARAIVRDTVLDVADIEVVLNEKMQIIRKSGLLEYCIVDEQPDAVGGMDLLKDWLRKRVRALGRDAREYGLPEPRGILLLGVQGCGKSLLAKSIASAWRMPLLRLDMSRIFQGYIGSSEDNMRRALRMAEDLAPVVLWIDEIEKAFSGVEGSANTDAGTTARVIGQFLTWMQEKSAPVFIAATANNIEHLPPELMRKGRLDEIFFVDLPRSRERAEIFQIHLRKMRRDPEKFDLRDLVRQSDGFSGAEIQQAIVSALHDSFFENRELETRDIIATLQETVPLSRTMREPIADLRAWATDRARPVSSLQLRNAAPGSE